MAWAPAHFKRGTTERPSPVVSTEAHPFHGEEYVALGVTTREQNEALDDEWVMGSTSTPERSYVNPWSLVTIKHASVSGGQGRLRAGFVDKAVERAARRYLGVRDRVSAASGLG